MRWLRAAPGGVKPAVAGAMATALACGLLAACAATPARAVARGSGTAGDAACEALPDRPDPGLAARLGAIVERAEREGFAGQVAVIRDGALVFRQAAGHADLESRIPVTDSTRFHVASLTKYFTAAAMLRAAEKGLLDIDAPIAPLVPGSPLAARGIIFADLLAHRSGLGSSYAAEGIRDSRAALAAIADAADASRATGEFRYSNDGYDLLAILLEQAAGVSYERFVRDELFGHACLAHAGFWGETEVADPRRVGQPLQPIDAALLGRNYGMLGSSGLLISAEDLALFQYRLDSGQVLGASSIRQLMSPRGKSGPAEATFGAFLFDHPRLGRYLSARGYEDWGDNAILNDYLDCKAIVAVVTSRGPPEETGKPPFRTSVSGAIEAVLADWPCP